MFLKIFPNQIFIFGNSAIQYMHVLISYYVGEENDSLDTFPSSDDSAKLITAIYDLCGFGLPFRIAHHSCAQVYMYSPPWQVLLRHDPSVYKSNSETFRRCFAERQKVKTLI